MNALIRSRGARCALGISERDHRIRDAAIGDQVFDAVEQESIAVTPILGGHFQGVRAGIGLGQSECQNHLARRRSTKILLVLRGCS